MKNRVLKKICGVMLSAVLTIAVAIPALAACSEEVHHIEGETTIISYPNASAVSHQVRKVISGYCTDCKEHITVITTTNELHTPDKNGKCTACGYQM